MKCDCVLDCKTECILFIRSPAITKQVCEGCGIVMADKNLPLDYDGFCEPCEEEGTGEVS